MIPVVNGEPAGFDADLAKAAVPGVPLAADRIVVGPLAATDVIGTVCSFSDNCGGV